MAAGAAPALDKKKEDIQTHTNASQGQPETFRQRIVRVLHDIFAGREEHNGWHQ